MVKNMKYAINGKFLSQEVTGVQRYARELLNELDKIICSDQVCIIYADDAKNIPAYKNIKKIKIGKKVNTYWLQVLFPFYCKRKGYVSINLCGSGPLIAPGIVCMHDIGFVHYPHFVSKKFYYWGLLQIWNSVNRAKGLITVSEFSRNDINSLYPKTKGRMVIIQNAWQHMLKVQEDTSVLTEFGDITKQNYYFAMSSLSPNKNINWIIETAKKNINEQFVVAGNINLKVFGDMNLQLPKNVILIGYISDQQAKTLMKNCKAFLFPTFFEGFGIPPMEALACGAEKIVVSDNKCMHEIYRDSAYYINPFESIDSMEELLSGKVDDPEVVLKRYSWKESAKKLKTFLKL